MTTIQRMKVPCGAMQGLRWEIIAINDMKTDAKVAIYPLQPKLKSKTYNATLENDACFALRYDVLEDPDRTNHFEVTIDKVRPIKRYKNNLKLLKLYNMKIKG